MPHEQPSEEAPQSVLAKVDQLHAEYLDATIEFKRILHLLQTDPEHFKGLKSLKDATKARKLALGRYIDAAVQAAGEDLLWPPGSDSHKSLGAGPLR